MSLRLLLYRRYQTESSGTDKQGLAWILFADPDPSALSNPSPPCKAPDCRIPIAQSPVASMVAAAVNFHSAAFASSVTTVACDSDGAAMNFLLAWERVHEEALKSAYDFNS
jgi:hypothetical protein